MKGQTFNKRLGFALQGLYLAFRREQSIRFHVLAAVFVLIVLLYTRPEPVWWALGGLTVGFVFVAELFNAALEALVDYLHPERHPEIGAVKDIAASAVLIAAIFALLVALAFLLR